MSKPKFVMQKLQSCNGVVQRTYKQLNSLDRGSAIKEALPLAEVNETFNLLVKTEERKDRALYIPIDCVTKLDDDHYYGELPKHVSVWLYM